MRKKEDTNQGETSEDGVWFGASEPDDSKGALPYDDYLIEELRCESNEGMNLLKFNVSVYKNSTTIDLGTLTNDKVNIATTAIDANTESHMSMADETVTIVDTVEYENLKKGQEYKVVGTLMDKETGKEILINGEKVTAETTFKAKLSTGSVEVVFVFDASGLQGKRIVAFEELYQEELLLAVHADIEDEDQTIYFPEIGTMAKDSETETGISKADNKVTIIDAVEYKNLIPKKEYKITGVLMDKATGEELLVKGEPVTFETVFTPEACEETVEVTFTFDATGMENKSVAVHADIEDNAQTIYFPEIGTSAKDAEDGDQEAVADEKVTIIDTVNYHNLQTGKTYKITGSLMDKTTGKALVIDGETITSETEFVAEKQEGIEEVTFVFNAKGLAKKEVVVYEKGLFGIMKQLNKSMNHPLVIVLYLVHEAPEDEQNFAMVMEMIRAGAINEDDDMYLSPLDQLFYDLEVKEPSHIAVKYYKNYRSGASKTLKSIQITLAARLEKFNLESVEGLTMTDELDFGSLGERKTALFAILPDNDKSLNYLVAHSILS